MKYLLAAIGIGLIVLPQPELKVAEPKPQTPILIVTSSFKQHTIDGKMLQGGYGL